MHESAVAIYNNLIFEEEERIFVEFKKKLPFKCEQNFYRYHGDDKEIQMIWSKASNKEIIDKNQFIKSIMVDLVSVDQERSIRKKSRRKYN